MFKVKTDLPINVRSVPFKELTYYEFWHGFIVHSASATPSYLGTVLRHPSGDFTVIPDTFNRSLGIIQRDHVEKYSLIDPIRVDVEISVKPFAV